MRAPAAAVHAGTSHSGSGISRRMRSWVALKIVGSAGVLIWLAALVANRALVSLEMMVFLIIVSLPYLFALMIALAKREFAGAMLVATMVALAAQLYIQIDLYLAPPDGQKGFVVIFLVFAQTLVVVLAAACADALESHRKNKAERAGLGR